jgi:hypothetical protein
VLVVSNGLVIAFEKRPSLRGGCRGVPGGGPPGEAADVDADYEYGEGCGHELGPKESDQCSSPDEKSRCQYEAGDRVGEEQGAVGGYVSVSFRPQVEMDRG